MSAKAEREGAEGFSLVPCADGSFSLKPRSSAESMHSSIGPWKEAQLIYIGQSHIARSLLDPNEEPLVLHDAGMGIAANALAAIELPRKRPLRIFSFENDPSGLETALASREKFPFLARHEDALRALLEDGLWTDGRGLEWRLLVGDFRLRVAEAPAPEIVFYDFYSAKVCPELWSAECFEKVRGPRTRLCTYSISTGIRAALLLAGFFVGYGPGTGAKSGTTIASTRLEDLEKPLGPEWLEHLRRSSKPYPYGWAESGRSLGDLEQALRARLQPQSVEY